MDTYVERHKFHGHHEGYCIGQKYLEGRMLPEFCPENELCISNKWNERQEEEGDIQNWRK